MINVILNSLLLVVLMLYFYFIGNVTSKNIKKISFIDPIILGFITFLSVFQVIALPFMYFHSSFRVFTFIVLTLSILSLILIFNKYKIKAVFLELKEYVLSKDMYIVYFLFIVMALMTLILGSSVVDSWLYTPMVLDTIETDIIYYTTNVTHNFDSYYLFNSVIIYIAAGRDYFTLILLMGAFENIMFLLALKTINDRYFKGYNTILLPLQLIAVFSGVSLFLPHYGSKDISTALFRVTASGTLFLYMITIPLLIEFIVSNRKGVLYLAILLISGLAFSSSTIFIAFCFVMMYICFNLYQKTLTCEGVNLMLMSFSLIIVACSLFFTNVIFLLLLIPLAILFIFNKEDYLSIIYKISKVVISLYLIYTVLYFLLSDFYKNVNNLFFEYPSETFTSLDTLYPNILTSPILILILIVGAYNMYFTEKKEYLILSLVALILFANRVSYVSFGLIIGQPVYHRVYMMAGLNIIFIYGFIYLYEMVKLKFKYIFLLFIMIVISGVGVKSTYALYAVKPYIFTNSFFESKIGYTEFYEFDQSIFEQGDTIYYKADRYKNNMYKMDQLNSNITMTNKYDYQDYIICGKESYVCSILEGNNIVQETQNYYLYSDDDITGLQKFTLENI